MPNGFPGRTFRRTRTRASGLFFAFGVDDFAETLVTGQSLALTRASGRTVVDGAGRLATIVHSQFPWSSFYNADAGVWEPALDVGPAVVNLCIRSEDLSTWTSVGTPTLTSAARTLGDVALDLLGDDAAGTLEGKTRTCTFTGNGVKAFALFVAQGSSTSSVIRFRDTTTSSNRLLAVLTWSGGLPSVAASTGTFIGYEPAGAGFRLLFQTTSVTAANTNQIEIYPATTSGLSAANQGTLYVGGVQAENQPAPGPYVRTAAATVSVPKDLVTCNVTLPLTDFTVYLRIGRPNWAGLTTGWPGNAGLFGMETAGTTAGAWNLYFDPLNQHIRSAIVNGGVGQTQFQAIPATSAISLVAQFRNLTSTPQTRIDVGGGFSSWSLSPAAITSWENTVLYLGSDSSQAFGARVRRAVIAPGLRDLADLQGVPV